MANIVPYSFNITTLPQVPQTAVLPGVAQGVYITIPGNYDWVLDKITGWFRERNEVSLVDHGTSDKAGLGYILLEWWEQEIDPLFLAILRDEESVADYSVYMRDL